MVQRTADTQANAQPRTIILFGLPNLRRCQVDILALKAYTTPA